MVVACATDDGQSFVTRHFGDAKQYEIYEWRDHQFTYLKTIVNTSEDKNKHADPQKAKQIMGLLLESKVNVGLTNNYGPNINKIKERLVPVMVSSIKIKDGLAQLEEHYEEVSQAIMFRENRRHIDLRIK